MGVTSSIGRPSRPPTAIRILRQGPGDRTTPSEVGTTKTPHFVDNDFPVRRALPTYRSRRAQLRRGRKPALQRRNATISPRSTSSRPPSPAGWPPSPDPSPSKSPGEKEVRKADTAGYYVYRSVDGGAFERVGDIVNLHPAFSDRKVEHGQDLSLPNQLYRPEKTNESGKSPPVEVSF